MTGSSGARRLRVAVGTATIGLALLVAAPAPAFAHNYLVSSTPAESSTLTELPEQFSVTTNEPLLDVSGEASGFALQIRDEDGGYYGDGCLAVAGATLSTGAALGTAGEYTVGWQVVSADGHTVDGEFAFTWEPGPGFEPAPPAAAPPTCGAAAGATGEAVAPGGSEEPPGSAAAVGATDLIWVLGTVVVVFVVLFGTLLLLTRRRSAPRE
jgi:methionine-rich copper-binding protein CopC